ncbi:MAG: DUF512 domain-containing protein [Clostridia bacterium]|nr:DUF512 domain-containing protein [Clostridia bacterium]
MSAIITKIDPRSPADKAGLQVGETLLTIGGHAIRDVMDYKFYAYDPKLTMEILSPCGARRTVRISKEEGQDLGLEFETYLMDAQKGCANRCVFCFIDQLPRGMRKSLYFKDDDARLSFLLGNYITMTNLSDEDADRIIRMKISPLNVSVHTTDPELRTRMLGNPNGGSSLRHLYAFAKAGIKIHAQIVACPGWNDGRQLEKTLSDLSALYPSVESVAVVPVGITRHREGLAPLTPVGEREARDMIAIIDRQREANLKKYDTAIVTAADEMYLKAHLPMPGPDYYEGYLQLDIGVGLMSLFEEELRGALLMEDEGREAPSPFTIACGMAAAPFMERMVSLIREKCPGLSGKVMGIRNEFFGETVDVSGLVTGGDLLKQLKGNLNGERLLLPIVMLRDKQNVFLDDVTPEDLERELKVKVHALEIDGGVFLDAVLEQEF